MLLTAVLTTKNCNIKQWIKEQNTKFTFKVYKYDRGDRRDSEVRGQEFKIQETQLNTKREQLYFAVPDLVLNTSDF